MASLTERLVPSRWRISGLGITQTAPNDQKDLYYQYRRSAGAPPTRPCPIVDTPTLSAQSILFRLLSLFLRSNLFYLDHLLHCGDVLYLELVTAYVFRRGGFESEAPCPECPLFS